MKLFDRYIRVSDVAGRTAPEEFQFDSTMRTAYAKKLGEFGETVVELDVSGAKRAQERELERLVRKVEDGESAGIVVWKVSRFSRDLLDGVTAAKRIIDKGGRIVGEDLDTANEMGLAMLGFLLGWAEEEWKARQKGWLDARRRAVQKRQMHWHAPFGYRHVARSGSKLVVVEAEAEIVREAFERRAAGESFASIERRFNWTQAHRMLANETYLGIARSGEFRLEGAHDAIVERALFERANAARTTRPAPSGATTTERLLSGLARCAGCGKTLKVTRRTKPDGGQYPDAYYCRDAAKERCQARAFVHCDDLEEHVVGWFLRAQSDEHAWVEATTSTADLEAALAAEEAAKAERTAYVKITPALDPDYGAGLAVRDEAIERARALVRERSLGASRLPAGGAMLALWEAAAAAGDFALLRGYLSDWLDRVVVTRGAASDLVANVDILWAGGVAVQDPRDAGMATA